MIVDRTTWWIRDYYTQCVIGYLQDAGVVEPNGGTPLSHICKDKCEYALLCLEHDNKLRLRRDYSTVSELATELRKAIKSR